MEKVKYALKELSPPTVLCLKHLSTAYDHILLCRRDSYPYVSKYSHYLINSIVWYLLKLSA